MSSYVIRKVDPETKSKFISACRAARVSPQVVLRTFLERATVHYAILQDETSVGATFWLAANWEGEVDSTLKID